MRLDQPRGDFQVGLDITLVDPDRHPARAFAKICVFVQDLAMMVFDTVAIDDLLPDHLDQLFAFVGAMQTGRVEDHDLLSRNAGRFKRAEYLGENCLIGDRASEVADHHTSVASTTGQFRQRG